MGVLRKYNDLPESTDDLSRRIVDCVFSVHKILGPGYVEKIYEDCLAMELEERGINFVRQFPLALKYKGRPVPCEFRLDMVVEGCVILELKAVERIHPLHEAQLYSYLKASGMPLGFLVNFDVPLIRDGIRRYVSKWRAQESFESS